MKLRWLNYFLVLILFNVLLHVFYLYLLLGAHDSLDSTASSLYSFEQALVLCKKEMIYRDLGLGTREALALHGNHSSQLVLPVDPEVGRHPDQFTKLELRLEPSEGVYDKWRLYKIHNFVVKADKWRELARQQVCIGSHATVDRMHWLVQMANRWTGPISVALFVPDVEFSIAKYFIEHLRSCYSNVRDRVTFHMIYPEQFPPRELDQLAHILESVPCEAPHVVMGNILTVRPVEMTGWRETLRYPQNLARNTAKQGCPTAYTIVPDTDMIPIPGMAERLDTFLAKRPQQECERCAYVIPVYEVKSTIGRDVMPVNKTELLYLVERYYARRFHQTVYLLNQLSSDLDRQTGGSAGQVLTACSRWESLPDKEETEIGFEVENYIFKYEPLYVARAETPIFDERFIGFGMTRNTQAYEMYIGGYKFLVLNNLFMNHWGLQKRETRPLWRRLQHLLNNRLFIGFAREITARYNRDPYNMMKKMEMPGFWGVKNNNLTESGLPGQADIWEIYQSGK